MTIKKRQQEFTKKSTPRWFYFIIVLIPVLFFFLLEAGLRIFNYGEEHLVFVEVPDNPDKFYLNPDLSKKYFSDLKQGPGVIPDYFDRIKKDNSFRVFALGESTTAGWPYMYTASFPANLRRKLELLYPENNIEIINCGASAINSYTIRDIVPSIIEQQPDLILIYAGHNEYYGALGVGSTSSFGRSRFLINTYLRALQFKTVQLIANIISEVSVMFSSSENEIEDAQPETLMSRMIGESLIPLNSDLYEVGISQYEENMRDILEKLNENNIPVIVSTLTCNIKDLKPFASIEYEKFPKADSVYEEAKKELERRNIKAAEKLFYYAKDLDALRFRAPTRINTFIKLLAAEFNYPVIDVDSLFKAESPDGLVGFNLTVDHLHPNIEGHKLISGLFFQSMEVNDLVPSGKRIDLPKNLQDSILTASFPFTQIDSVLSNIKIMQLTGAYPFVTIGQPNEILHNFKQNNFIDSTAIRVFNKEISWGEAHSIMASYYYNRQDYQKFLKEVDALIAAAPFKYNLYEEAIELLTQANLLQSAIPYLEKLHAFKPSSFTTKWLGQAALLYRDFQMAQKFLEMSITYADNDYQVWYNLAGIYYNNNEFVKSLSAIERSLTLNPDYPLAKNVYQKLKSLNYK